MSVHNLWDTIHATPPDVSGASSPMTIRQTLRHLALGLIVMHRGVVHDCSVAAKQRPRTAELRDEPAAEMLCAAYV